MGTHLGIAPEGALAAAARAHARALMCVLHAAPPPRRTAPLAQVGGYSLEQYLHEMLLQSRHR